MKGVAQGHNTVPLVRFEPATLWSRVLHSTNSAQKYILYIFLSVKLLIIKLSKVFVHKFIKVIPFPCYNGSLLTHMILSFQTDRSGQTVQTQIRLLLEEQSDQGLHCMLFHWHHFDKRFGLFVWISGRLQQRFWASQKGVCSLHGHVIMINYTESS